ncbi:MAG: DUF997 family protein [Pirellulales bacterium]
MYVHGRREAVVILAVWATCLIWTVGTSYALGYGAPTGAVETIWGIPHWVFWGVLVPWVAATVFSLVFSLGFMADDDLGEALDDVGVDGADVDEADVNEAAATARDRPEKGGSP